MNIEAYEAGWNAGYLVGEFERVALATANSDLRSELLELSSRILVDVNQIVDL